MTVSYRKGRRCGSPSRWRWAEPCHRPSCNRCFRRFIDGEIAKAITSFGSNDAHKLGWLTIDLGSTSNLPALGPRTTNRLRNTIDRERRRLSRWDEVEVRTLFRTNAERLTLSGFVYLAEVAPHEFARVLAHAWSIDAVQMVTFSGHNAAEHIQEYGACWRVGREPGLTAFRSIRLTVGARWVKKTRHWSPMATGTPHLEPLPVSFGYDGSWF